MVEACFGGGSMTSHGGVMLLVATDGKLGLMAAAAGCIADPRNPLLITHGVTDMLRQRVYGLLWADGLGATVRSRREPDRPLGGGGDCLCSYYAHNNCEEVHDSGDERYCAQARYEVKDDGENWKDDQPALSHIGATYPA